MPSQIELALRVFRRELLDADSTAVKQVLAQYAKARDGLISDINAFAKTLDGNTMTANELIRSTRAKELLAQVESEMTKLAARSYPTISGGQADVVAMAGEHAEGMATVVASGDAAASALVTSSWNRLPASAVESLIGRMSDGSPLKQTLASFGSDASKTISGKLVEAISLGRNPLNVAADLTTALDGDGARLLTVARTEMLGAYRAATLQDFSNNADILDGWIWVCGLDGSCPACLGMHGTVHPNSEEFFPDHPNCRCNAIPNVKGTDNPVTQTGDQWLKTQSEEEQDKILGKEGGRAFRAGEVQTSDFVRVRESDQWGPSTTNGGIGWAKEQAAIRGDGGGTTTAADVSSPEPVAPFSSLPEADAWSEQFGEWRSGLTAEEVDTLGVYRGSGYHDLNGVLREGRISEDGLFHSVANEVDIPISELRAEAETIDAAIAKSEIDSDVVAYRGSSTAYLGDLDNLPGTIIEDQGYVSTSLDREVGERFIGYKAEEGKDAALLEITIPKGTNAAYLDTLNSGGKPWERELLLPRGSRFEVTDSTVGPDGIRVIQVKVIP